MQGLTLAGTYIVILAAGLSGAVGIGLMTDKINAPVSMLAFFGAAAVVAMLAWPLAVRLTRPAV